jgi:hypothetical protein
MHFNLTFRKINLRNSKSFYCVRNSSTSSLPVASTREEQNKQNFTRRGPVKLAPPVLEEPTSNAMDAAPKLSKEYVYRCLAKSFEYRKKLENEGLLESDPNSAFRVVNHVRSQ